MGVKGLERVLHGPEPAAATKDRSRDQTWHGLFSIFGQRLCIIRIQAQHKERRLDSTAAIKLEETKQESRNGHIFQIGRRSPHMLHLIPLQVKCIQIFD